MSMQTSPDEVEQDYSIPAELINRDQWLCWEEVKTDGRKRKMPRVSDGSGDAASTSDPTTWGSFETVLEEQDRHSEWGIGFVLTEDDPYLAVDFDDVRDPDSGETEDWVLEIVDQWASYTEVSPSETGLHVWLKDVTEPDWWVDTDHIEVYDSGQYITVTDDHLSDTPTRCTTPSNFEPWLEGHAELDVTEPPSQESQGESGDCEMDINIDVHDVLSRASYPEGKRVSHPYHDSRTGENFQVFEGGEVWHCYRHEVNGSALHLIGIEQGVINCGDVNRGLTDKEWAKIFEAGREAGYDLPEPSDESAQSSPANIVEALIESQEKWISKSEKTMTVWDVGEQDAAEVKEVFEDQSLDSEETLEIIRGLDDEYSDAFDDFLDNPDEWTVRLATPEDKWQRVRAQYEGVKQSMLVASRSGSSAKSMTSLR